MYKKYKAILKDFLKNIYEYIYPYLLKGKKHIKKDMKRVEKLSKNKLRSRIIAFFSFALFLIFFFPAFHTPGLIVFGDIDFGFSSQNYISRIFPLWNDLWSSGNFFNSTRVFFVSLSEIFLHLFGDYPGIYQKIIMFCFLQVSFFGMFLFISQILIFQKHAKHSHTPYSIIFIIAFIAGVFYALNPWSIMRIQHLYLLAGYAVLPCIFYKVLFFSEYEKVYSKKLPLQHILIASLLYLIGIGAVHYVIFIFLFIFSWYLMSSITLIIKRQWRSLLRLQIPYFLMGGILGGLIMYWFVPFLGASFIDTQAPENLNTLETINMFSRFSSIQNVLYLTSYWWSMIDFSSFGPGYWGGGILMLGTIFVINLYNIRDKYSLFFLLWAVALVILSTGTHGIVKHLYTDLVFNNPFGSMIGSLFRDPNKFVGLLAFCYGVLWAIGISVITSKLILIRHNIKKENKKLSKNKLGRRLTRLYARNIILRNLVFIVSFLYIYASIVGYSFYIKPFKQVYINNFYNAVLTPPSYSQLLNYQRNDNSQGKYMYLPRYENIQSPGYGFAIADWNISPNGTTPKPTGSIDLASTLKPTYHPLEGVNVFTGYFYYFIDHYLSKNIGENIANYLSAMNIETLVYHSDIVGIEEKQQQHISNLKKQSGLQHTKNFGFIDIFTVDKPIGYGHVFENDIFIFGGIKKLETLFNFPNFPFKKFASIFPEQQIYGNTHWKSLESSNDLVVTNDKISLMLSMLDKRFLFAPFKQTQSYDPYFRWSIMKAEIPDFRWHLKQTGITNWPWDFDYNTGFIFTYAPASVNIESYNSVFDKGVDLIDIDQYNDISELFTSNSDKLILGLGKKNIAEGSSAVKGKVFRGDEDKVWKIAEMLPQQVKPSHPYTIEMNLSGLGVNMLHGKVKFFDKDFEEIGVSYAVTPRYLENFDAVKFRGSFITPVGTQNIIVQIATLQKPSQETYWWLHDLKLRDLGEYKIENTFKGSYSVEAPGKYHVFMRSMDNIKGGDIGVRIEQETFQIPHRTEFRNEMTWKKLGAIEVTDKLNLDIGVNNMSGFNAVNMFAFVPDDVWSQQLQNYHDETLIQGKQIIVLEAEADFEKKGNIQSSRNHSYLSNGKSIQMHNGKLYKEIEILKTSSYIAHIGVNPDQKNKGYIYVKLLQNGQQKLLKIFPNPEEALSIDFGTLQQGSYTLEVGVVDSSTPLIYTRQLELLNPEYHEWDYPADEIGCTYYNGIAPYQSRYEYPNGNVRYFLDRGTSCYWLITTRNYLTPVEAGEQYLVSYDLRKRDTKKLHSKVKFFDENREFMDGKNIYVYDHWLDADLKTHHVESILDVPEGAKYMRFEFWQKQRQEYVLSQVDISNFWLKKYRDMPGVDSVIIYDSGLLEGTHSLHFTTPGENIQTTKHGKMKVVGTIASPVVNQTMQLAESYTQLWKIKQDTNYISPIITNIFLSGYHVKNPTNKIENKFLPVKYMYIGYAISVCILLLVLSIIIITEYRDIKKKKKN